MASEKRPPGSQGTRRRRPVPTIDLKATEVAPESAAVPEPPAETAKPAAATATAVESSASLTASTEPPPQQQAQPSGSEPPPPPPREEIAWFPPNIPWRAIGAGAGGGAAVLALFLLIWTALPRSGDTVATLAPRLAAIETQLRDLAARPAPAGIDAKAIDAFSARLSKLESALNAPRPAAADPALTGRIGALENAVKPLNDSVAALARRADETDATFRNIRGRADQVAALLAELQGVARTSSADHGEIEKFAARISALEKSDRAVADQLAKSAAAANSDRPVRLVVATAALRTALDRGEPFAAELATVQTLSKDTDAFSALGPFASSGLPSAAALGRELLVLLPVIQRAAGTTPREGGFIDRLQANAERLVRIRPLEEVAGEDMTAILSRLEVKAAHADIAGTLAELAKLPPASRAPAFDWIAKAEARGKAVEASRRLASDAIAALKTNP